tara:strand:+ start:39 stop:311 length:273 start_codon:yes stop_codon:yes gene_type:complete
MTKTTSTTITNLKTGNTCSQEQFNEIVESLINGKFNRAVNLVIEYDFYAQDIKVFVGNTEWCHNHKYFDSEDLYEVIERATEIRTEKECL